MPHVRTVEAVEAAGVDMVLFNSATPNTEMRLIESAIVSAVNHGVVSQATLNSAVTAVLSAKRVDLC